MDFFTDIPLVGAGQFLSVNGGQIYGTIDMNGHAIQDVVIAQKYTVHTIADGDTYTLFTTFTTTVLSPAGNNISATLIFPASPSSGQNVVIAGAINTISSLTLQANAGQVLATGNITSLAPGQFATWIAAFIGPTCYWVRTA